jgi:hypothetical protein
MSDNLWTQDGAYDSFESAYADAWNRHWGASIEAQDAATPEQRDAARDAAKTHLNTVENLRAAADQWWGPRGWHDPAELRENQFLDWCIEHAPQVRDEGRAR